MQRSLLSNFARNSEPKISFQVKSAINAKASVIGSFFLSSEKISNLPLASSVTRLHCPNSIESRRYRRSSLTICWSADGGRSARDSSRHQGGRGCFLDSLRFAAPGTALACGSLASTKKGAALCAGRLKADCGTSLARPLSSSVFAWGTTRRHY